jgi:hypothetical protein
MMSKSNLADVDVCLHHKTDNAVLVSGDGVRKNAVWIPKSQCEVEHIKGTTWRLTAEQPLLEEKELV